MAGRIDPALPLAESFALLTDALADDVRRHLCTAADNHALGLHQARKAIKRLRALLRLYRSAAPAPLKRCDREFGTAARAIAGPREATALVETVDRFIAAYPKRIVDARLGEIRVELMRRADRIGEDVSIDDHIAEARTTFDAAMRELRRIDLSGADAGTLEHGVRKALKRWSGALDRARKKGGEEAFHDLRKAVKAHAAQLTLLEAFWPEDWRRRRKSVDDLGELLGELNDIHVMRDALRRGTLDLPTDIEPAGFVKLLDKERKRLSRRALVDAHDHLESLPAGLGKSLRTALAAAPPLEPA